jgi:hypothetical protein
MFAMFLISFFISKSATAISKLKMLFDSVCGLIIVFAEFLLTPVSLMHKNLDLKIQSLTCFLWEKAPG